jgi:hypothetical protein
MNACRLVGKLKVKRPLGQRYIWVDNIKVDLGKIVWVGMNWVGLGQDRNYWRALVNAVMNLLFV